MIIYDWNFVDKNLHYFPGAQSDSELPSTTSVVSGGSDRGYTSDSELETQSRSRATPAEFEVRAVPENGSWMLVMYYTKFTKVMKRFQCNSYSSYRTCI